MKSFLKFLEQFPKIFGVIFESTVFNENDLERKLREMLHLQALAVGMEQPPDFLLSKHSQLMGSGNCTSLRMLYYPPIGAPEPDITRCGAHCDYGTFTLLTQVRSIKLVNWNIYIDKDL